ncbi:lipopolysaccharide biosynthesis protein [Butyrivibrio sp. LC3010]|uniref:lipopolysaccharide biosynthesis protein n=1 Tax=Butyrivibrio sp. LC3010 TaxID=1280680 RepID=UPI0004159203|nr:oligosaccharide flippase family protein [Butyrivibrio sp. LC3010]
MSDENVKVSVNSQVIYNVVGIVIRSSVVFFTMPLFTRILGTVEYGKFSVYSSWMAIIICFIGLNVSAGLSKGYYKFSNEYYQFRSSVIMLGVISCFFVTIFLMVCYPAIARFIKFPISIYFLLLCEATAQFILNFANLAWTYEKKAKLNMLVSVCILIATTLLALVLLKYNWLNLEYRYYARVIGGAIPQIIGAICIFLAFVWRGKKIYCKKYWNYSLSIGIPLIFHLVSQQILGQSDRVMMQMMNIDSSQIGIYSFVYSFTGFLTIILSALNNAWCPFYFDCLSNCNYDKLEEMIRNYVEIFTSLVGGFLLLSREVVRFFADESYQAGDDLIPVIVIAIYIIFSYQFAVNYEMFYEKPRIIACGTVIAALINVFLNYLWISKYGMVGAAFATLISYFLLAILHFVVVFSWEKNKYPMTIKYNFIGFFIVIILCLVFHFAKGLIILRWGLACVIGCSVIYKVYSRKTIF